LELRGFEELVITVTIDMPTKRLQLRSTKEKDKEDTISPIRRNLEVSELRQYGMGPVSLKWPAVFWNVVAKGEGNEIPWHLENFNQPIEGN
jgi:hypothetical protein